MKGWRGIIAGIFGLSVVEVVVSSQAASASVGGIWVGAANALRYFLDPNTPAIPDRGQHPGQANSNNTTPAGSPNGVPTQSTTAQALRSGGALAGRQ